MKSHSITLLAVLILAPLVAVGFTALAWWYAEAMTRDRITSSTFAPARMKTQTGDRSTRHVASARTLYQVYCAQCHGETGDGQGTRSLDRPARSFKDGGFSFGNTPEAIYRTISSGIGGTPMPGYATTLSEADRHRLAAYVRTLGPPTIDVNTADTIMTVTDQARVVRGHLPALQDGLPEHPRGLLIGTTDGLSFQYSADDVRLLAVRQGDFVERTDWNGRGGTPLKPLGNIIDLIDDGRPKPTITLEGSSTSRLVGTSVKGRHAVLRYRIESDAHSESIDVEEWGEAISLPAGSGYRRHLSLSGMKDAPASALNLRGSDVPVIEVVRGNPTSTDNELIWIVRRRDDGQYLLEGVRGSLSIDTDGISSDMHLPLPREPELQIELITLMIPDWNDRVRDELLNGGSQ